MDFISKVLKTAYYIIFFFSCNLSLYGQNDSLSLNVKLDSLVQDAIDSLAFPGAQVLVLHQSKIIHHKAYGHHTYKKATKVDTSNVYDLASVTKVIAGGLSLMKMNDQRLFNPNMQFGETHPFLKYSPKAKITWREILAHQSGMEPYIVFWQKMKNKKGNYKKRTFTYSKNKHYPFSINDSIYLHKRYPKMMRKAIKASPLRPQKDYLYSGLAFLLIPQMVSDRTDKGLDEYLNQQYFNPMGLNSIGFRPLSRHSIENIIPTEIDTFFRYQLVHGYVHDENASMLGGISANAGLFSNAYDLGQIGLMLMNKGRYHNFQFLKPSTVQEFTSVQFPDNKNRRGLTFDKPPLEYNASQSYVAESASPSSFGHSGFTGTFIWIDPEYELIVVFLSNRVHPFRSSRSLYTSNFRPQLHQMCYNYIRGMEINTDNDEIKN